MINSVIESFIEQSLNYRLSTKDELFQEMLAKHDELGRFDKLQRKLVKMVELPQKLEYTWDVTFLGTDGKYYNIFIHDLIENTNRKYTRVNIWQLDEFNEEEEEYDLPIKIDTMELVNLS